MPRRDVNLVVVDPGRSKVHTWTVNEVNTAPRGRVLVVDDDPFVLRVLRRILTRCGIEVIEALGAEAALSLSADDLGRVDVVLTDVNMPGIDGPTLVQRLTVAQPNLRALYMSGYDYGRIAARGIARESYLAKPFAPEEVRRVVTALLPPRAAA